MKALKTVMLNDNPKLIAAILSITTVLIEAMDVM